MEKAQRANLYCNRCFKKKLNVSFTSIVVAAVSVWWPSGRLSNDIVKIFLLAEQRRLCSNVSAAFILSDLLSLNTTDDMFGVSCQMLLNVSTCASVFGSSAG